MTEYPKRPEDYASREELERLVGDPPALAAYWMGQCVPFNQMLGLEVLEATAEHALLRLPYRPELVGDPFRPALHGGALAMLADTSGGTAVLAGTQPGDKVSTLDMRIDYLRQAKLVDTTAEARVVRVGNRAVVVRIHIWQDDPNEPDGRSHVADSTAVYSVWRSEEG